MELLDREVNRESNETPQKVDHKVLFLFSIKIIMIYTYKNEI